MTSLWTGTSDFPSFENLKENIKTDVLIIGGGIAGILLAYRLQKAGVDYVLAEAETLCSGITKDTTAKITSQHGLIYDKLLREFGTEHARLYYEANQKALVEFRSMCRRIECGYEEKDSFVYSRNHPEKIEKELQALEKIGADASFSPILPLPFSVAGAVKFEEQAQFHPLKFLSALAADLNIYEHTPVIELGTKEAVTDKVKIRAKHVVATTHFPFLNKHGSYFLKMYQHRSYVIAFKNVPLVQGMYVDEAKDGFSFRNYDDFLLVGGGAHRTGKKGGDWRVIRELANQYYPNSHEAYCWATQDCMTLDGVPYIGLYSKNTPELYVATGFNKWGMTSAMVSSMLLTDMITGKNSPYTSVFSPSRSILRPQLFINSVEAVTNLLQISKKRCPHLGCVLKWNAQEHSWDCPCHGSRFKEDGKLIDNPATGNLKT